MDKTEAKIVIIEELKSYRSKSYEELVKLVGNLMTYEIQGVSGINFQIEIQFLWDRQPNGDIRVVGAVDDGGWSAFIPLTKSFIKSPSGEFVDE
jgi:hypothetical protein